MRVFIINLERSKARRRAVIEQLSGMPLDYDFFDAIDGKLIPNVESVYDTEESIRLNDRELSIGEIGCALSHRSIYQKMVDENIEKALICEDDIVIYDDFRRVFPLLSEIKIQNGIILLGQRPNRKVPVKIYKKKIYGKYRLVVPIEKFYGAFAYIIDIKAAKRILGFSQKIVTVADAWFFYKKTVTIRLVTPSIITQTEDFGSDIDSIDLRSWKRDDSIPSFFEFNVRRIKKLLRICKVQFMKILP